jgi:hypothetical protein
VGKKPARVVAVKGRVACRKCLKRRVVEGATTLAPGPNRAWKKTTPIVTAGALSGAYAAEHAPRARLLKAP